MPGAERAQSLADYVSAVVENARLLEEMDWDAVMAAVGQTPREAFVELMTGTLHDIDMAMIGMDQMSLIEQAQQAQTIQAMIVSARQAEIQYLQQIDQISQGIARSIEQQIEQLELGGMTDFQQGAYAGDQLADIFQQLMTGGLSPDVVQSLVGDAQRYIDMIAGLMGDEGLSGRLSDVLTDYFGGSAFMELFDLFPAGVPASMTGREFLVQLLEQLGTVSEAALEEARQEAAALNDQYIERLTAINERLTTFEGGLDDLGGDAGTVGGLNDELLNLNQKSMELGDEFERVTSALNGWDPNYIMEALRERVMIDIDPNLAPLIQLIESIVDARTGGGLPARPGGIH
jgi:hypothetical protein